MNVLLCFYLCKIDLFYVDLVQDVVVDFLFYIDLVIFEVEMDKIFYKIWIWVVYESEIKNFGDFKIVQIGCQLVIVVCDKIGKINVLENCCCYCGVIVCEKYKGNVIGFICFYYSWFYGLDGKLCGLFYLEGYEDVIEKVDLLLQSLCVESYNGMIFVFFNQEIELLLDFFGYVKKWIDLFMK